MSSKIKGFNATKDWVFLQLVIVESLNISTDEKVKKIKELGVKCKFFLRQRENYTANDKKEGKSREVGLTTYNRYVTRLRTDILNKPTLYPDFFSLLELFQNKFKKLKIEMDSFAHLNSRDIENTIKDTLKKIKIRLKKSRAESTIKMLNDAFDELSNMRAESPIMLTLIRTIEEKEQLEKLNEDRKVTYLKKPRIFSGLNILDLTHSLLAQNDWESLAIGVAIATGRRCSEVMYFGEFKKEKEYLISFKGQLKNRLKKEILYKIPTLVKTDLIISALDKLRKTDRLIKLAEKVEKYNDIEKAHQISMSVASQLNSAINKLLFIDEQAESWRFKDTRAIYARLSYAIYEANSKKAGRLPIQELEYFKKTLLHTNLNEAISYLQFKLSDAEQLNSYKIKKVKSLSEHLKFEDRTETLKKMLDDCEDPYTVGYLVWAIEELKNDFDFAFNNKAIRAKIGGNTQRSSLFIKMLKEKKLHKSNLIKPGELKKEEAAKPKIIKERFEIKTTLTFYSEIEIQYVEGDDRDEILRNIAVDNAGELEACEADDRDFDFTEL